MKGRDGSGRVSEGTIQRWRERLEAGRASISADFVVPSNPTGWVVMARPRSAAQRPGTQVTSANFARSGVATMVLNLPTTDARTVAGWIQVAVAHLRHDLRQDTPIAYLGGGRAAAPGWMVAAGGALNGVMAWNARPGAAWSHLPAVGVPSLLVVDNQSPSLVLLARGAAWRLGGRPQVVTGVPVDGVGVLSSWYSDRLLQSPVRALRPSARQAVRRRVASMAVAGAVVAAPAGAYAVAAATGAAALPDFSSGRRLASASMAGDSLGSTSGDSTTSDNPNAKRLKPDEIGGDGPIGDPPLTDGIGMRWNINTNVGFTTTSSASGAVSEGAFTHAVAASTLNGGTINQTLNDAFDGYNALCLDVNNVGGQCNTLNMAVHNPPGPSALECSGRQVVTPLATPWMSVPQPPAGVDVRRKVFVPTNEGFARWLNIFTNNTGVNQTIRMNTSNNLGSDAGTRVVTTSDGDATPELTDTWVTTFQNYSGTTSSDPRIGHVLRGPGAPVGLSAINFVNGDDNPFWRYQFVLAPGQTGIIMNFATGQATKAAAATESAALANLSSANALACMTATEREQVVNFVAGVADTLTTSASAGGPLGTQVSDTATLSGFNGPTGTIVFNLYGPNDATCANAPVFTSAAVPVNGNGNYNSGNFAPVAAGVYRWTAVYSGDAINPTKTSACNADNESVTITAPGPGISTQASGGGALGVQVTDTATLTGGTNPTGTLTFTLYGPNDATCANPPVFTDGATVNGNGNYTSDPFAPSAPGVYRWVVVYGGDPNNGSVTSPCNAANESVSINKVKPSISTQASAGVAVGQPISDTATLAGGANPTGSVAFTLYGPDDATCTGSVIYAATVPVNGNGNYNSGNHSPTAPGVYRWEADYSGDANNDAVSSLCNALNESVTVTKANPSISTQASPGGPPGISVTDTATVSGGFSPAGNVTFRLFTNDTCTSQVFTSTNALVGSTATSGSFQPAASGTYYWTAVYNGDANNNTATSPCKAPNESVVVGAPACTTTLTGDVAGPIVVNSGASYCIKNAKVTGPVTVNAGGALDVSASQITGGIVATSPTFFRVCGSQIAAPPGNPSLGLVVQNATAPFLIGDTSVGCATNRVAGDVRLLGNTGGLTLGNNIVSRNVNVDNNVGGTVVVKGNQVFGTLACSGNNPPPTNAGQPNTGAVETGQCSGL